MGIHVSRISLVGQSWGEGVFKILVVYEIRTTQMIILFLYFLFTLIFSTDTIKIAGTLYIS